MKSAASFSVDYGEAREKFRNAAATAGGELEAIQHPEKGLTGADLFTDVARFGPAHAEKILVLISGTHGTEGFCGSGAQIDFLHRGEVARLPKELGLLMIHAINPYGFAWLRRVTHENIDLNRNWIDFSQPLPENPAYDALSAALCPDEWNEVSWAASEAAMSAFAAREGAAALKQAVSGGQYRHPKGLFYGGAAPSWSRITQTRIFEHYLGQAAAVGIIDYHSGLGPPGFGERIITSGSQTPAFQRAARWYGAALTSIAEGTSVAARVMGDGLSAAASILPNCTVMAMALEFGTRPREEILFAFRADAWLHAYGDPLSPLGQAIKRQVRAVSYIDTDDWKGMVAGQALLACRQAIAGLATETL